MDHVAHRLMWRRSMPSLTSRANNSASAALVPFPPPGLCSEYGTPWLPAATMRAYVLHKYCCCGPITLPGRTIRKYAITCSRVIAFVWLHRDTSKPRQALLVARRGSATSPCCPTRPNLSRGGSSRAGGGGSTTGAVREVLGWGFGFRRLGFWVQGGAEREFFIDNLLVRIHFIIEMIWWTGLAPWEGEHLGGRVPVLAHHPECD